MSPRAKFIAGAAVIVAGVTFLIYSGVRETGVYFLTPTELITRVEQDPSFHDVGIKVGAKVVRGSIHRDDAKQQVDFEVTDGARQFAVTYVGIVPDTFTDANEIEVIVEGKYGRDGVFRATEVLAKCGSRYEAELEAAKAAA